MRDSATVVITADGDYYIHVPELIGYINAHAHVYERQGAQQGYTALTWLAQAIAAGVAEMETIPDDPSSAYPHPDPPTPTFTVDPTPLWVRLLRWFIR